MQGQVVADGLELVRDFVNADDVVAWIDDVGLLEDAAARMPDAERGRLRELARALRALCLENNGGPVDAAAMRVFEQAALRARLTVRLSAGGRVELVPRAAGADGPSGRMVAIAASAMADGRWSRLKACRADDCLWAYVDTTRNGSRSWCSMAVCGNRAKARAYRARHGARSL